MAHPGEHAKSSARRYGGQPEDYLPIHHWMDESRGLVGDFRHRALRHHTEGMLLAEKIFGQVITNSDGKDVYVRYITLDHIKEDLGFVPSFQDWVRELPIRPWMYGQRQTKTEEL